MTIKFSIEWTNAGHSLLSQGTLGLLLDGVPQKPTKKASGVREYLIEDAAIVPGKTKLVLLGGFSLSTNDVKVVDQVGSGGTLRTAPGMTADVLRVRQEYRFISVDELAVVPTSPFTDQHPLVVSTLTVKAVKAQVYTDWVDVTPFWEAYAAEYETFVKEKPASIMFRAIAYTGDSRDWIWLVCSPPAAQTASSVGAVIHFPYPVTTYTGVASSQDMYYPNRHLLSPDPTEPATGDPGRRSVFTATAGDFGAVLRGGFLKGLLDSGKKVVLFYLAPTLPGFGPSVTNKLPKMLDRALRLLHAEQVVAAGATSIARERVAVSGYSGGGFSVTQALQSNASEIDELYAMDLAGFAGGIGVAKTWFDGRKAAKKTPCLRLTGWLQAKPNRTLYGQLAPSPDPDVSVSPPPDSAIDAAYLLPLVPPDASKPNEHGNALWNDCLVEYTAQSAAAETLARKNEFARHQFGLQGASGNLAGGQYFAEFLRKSHFT